MASHHSVIRTCSLRENGPGFWNTVARVKKKKKDKTSSLNLYKTEFTPLLTKLKEYFPVPTLQSGNILAIQWPNQCVATCTNRMLKGAEVVRNHDSCVMNAPKMEKDMPRTKNLGKYPHQNPANSWLLSTWEKLTVPESNGHIIWSVFQWDDF